MAGDLPAFFTGIENRFRGQYLHSWEYKDSASFQGKRVLVLGVGNSGGDIAVEISRVAAQVQLWDGVEICSLSSSCTHTVTLGWL